MKKLVLVSSGPFDQRYTDIDKVRLRRMSASDRAEIEIRADIYAGVWPAAAELRRSGGLLQLGARIECPVVAIHGSYDPHPAAGVEEPLAGALSDFRFVLLEECGHKPWFERLARHAFYRILRDETR